jgi:hypothetical protein
MQRKLYVFLLAALLVSFVPQTFAQRGKSELALGYGRFSLTQFANLPPYNTSSGTFSLTYRYYVSRTVTLGLNLGYEHISNWANFTTVAPELTVKYLDTKNSDVRVRLYGSFSYGITVLNDLHTGPGQADESGAKPWGFQATPIGIRVGRQFAWFMEIGAGYKGIFHGGLAVRVPRYLHHREHDVEAH